MVEYFALGFCLFVSLFLLKRKDVHLVEFMHRVFTRMPGGFVVVLELRISSAV